MRRLQRRNPSSAICVFELAIMALVVGFVLVAPAMPARAAQNYTVDMYDYYFSPKFLTVNLGDTITWHNLGTVAHTATSNTSAWTAVVLNPGQTSAPVTMTVAGTLDYYCAYHVAYDMWGQLTVLSGVPEFSSSIVVVAGMLAMAIGLLIATKRRSG